MICEKKVLLVNGLCVFEIHESFVCMCNVHTDYFYFVSMNLCLNTEHKDPMMFCRSNFFLRAYQVFSIDYNQYKYFHYRDEIMTRNLS